MVHMLDWAPGGGSKGRERAVAGLRSAFDDAGVWIGAVSAGGAVFDGDGVQVGVEWPHGEIVDFRGVRIGRA